MGNNIYKLQVAVEATTKGLKKGLEKGRAEVDQFKRDVDRVLKDDLGTNGLEGMKKVISDEVKKAAAPLKKLSSIAVKPKVETEGYKKLRQQLAAAKADLEKYKALEAKTPKEAFTTEYTKLETELRKLEKEYKKAEEDLEKFRSTNNKRYSTTAEDAKIKALEKLDMKMSQVNAKMEAMEAMEADGTARMTNPAYSAAATKTDNAKGKVANIQGKMGQMVVDGKQYVKNESVFTRLRKSLSNLIPSFRKTRKASGDMSKGMRSTYGTGGPLSRMFRTLAISARFMIASMIFQGAFNAMKTGFTDLASYSSSTKQALTTLKSSLVQLRGSFASAFAPILSYVAPVLNYLIEMLADALTAVAKFFAYLTGQETVTVAIPATRAFEGTKEAADDANGSAQELKRTLMGFDQINKLDDNTSSSGSSGNSGSSYTGSEFTTIETGASDFAKLFKESWEKADFTEIGNIVADKLNNALESIPWDKIQAKCQKIAKSIGTFINGFVEEFDWALLAQTISKGIETAMDTVSTLLKTIDWQSIGKAIVDFLCGIDFEGLIKSSATLLGSLVGGLAGLIWGAIEELANKIGGEFKQSIEDCGGNIVLGILEGLGNAVYKIGEWIVTFFDSFVQGFKDAFGIASPAKKMNSIGENIILGIKEGFINKVQDLIDWIKALPGKLLGAIGEKITIGIELVKEGWTNIKDWIGEKVSIGISLVKDKWTSLKDWIGSNVSTVTVGVKLKKAWSNTKKALGINNAFKLKFKLPKIKVKWGTKKVAGFTIKFPNGFSTYAKGGFPEEGPFYMNRGEIAGKFSNGKSVVANNQQITEGIANAVGPAVYAAMVSALSGSNGGNVTIRLEGDAKKLFKVVQTEANNYMQATGQVAFNM